MKRDHFAFVLTCLAALSMLGCGSSDSNSDSDSQEKPPVVQELNIQPAAPPAESGSGDSDGSSTSDGK